MYAKARENRRLAVITSTSVTKIVCWRTPAELNLIGLGNKTVLSSTSDTKMVKRIKLLYQVHQLQKMVCWLTPAEVISYWVGE